MAALNGGAVVLEDVPVVPLVLADVPAVPLDGGAAVQVVPLVLAVVPLVQVVPLVLAYIHIYIYIYIYICNLHPGCVVAVWKLILIPPCVWQVTWKPVVTRGEVFRCY